MLVSGLAGRLRWAASMPITPCNGGAGWPGIRGATGRAPGWRGKRRTGTDSGAATKACPVAKLTVALTWSMAFSFFSTRAAHAAQVIPWTANPTCRGADDASGVTVADDT